jgi:hypothetical protein
MAKSAPQENLCQGDFRCRQEGAETAWVVQFQIPQILRNGRKRMLRKKGGQPHNRNAVTHGRFSAPTRAERRAAAEERAAQDREWLMAMPKTDYDRICDTIASEKTRRSGGLH